MKRKLLTGLVCMCFLLTSLACQLVTGNTMDMPQKTVVDATQVIVPNPTSPVDVPSAEQVDQQNAQATRDAATAEAEETAAAETATVQAATEAVDQKATEQAAQETALTATVEGMATQQANDMAGLIDELKSKGYLAKTAGTYYPLEDFKEDWAQLGWYQWWTTGYKPADFVVRAHTTWESASRTADWYAAGCGFVFRSSGEDNHYMIYLALDGNVYLKGYVNGKLVELGKEYAGRIERVKGEADIVLVVEGDRILYFVNGEKVFERKNKSLTEGDLGLTLVSGTNKDYGTRCAITNIDLWDLSNQ